jgi:hypothetical protein
VFLCDQQKRHWPDLLLPVHRHDVDACDLPVRGSSSTVAVAMRQTSGVARNVRNRVSGRGSRLEMSPFSTKPSPSVRRR